MPEIIAPNLGLSYGWIDGENGWGGPMSESMRKLDALVHLAVLATEQSEPPVVALEGDRYIIGQNPVGVWADHATHIAVRIEGSWRFYIPSFGYRARVASGGFVWFDGVQWVPEDGGGGGGDPGGGVPPLPPRFYDIGISAIYKTEPGEVLAAIPLAQACMLVPGAAGSYAISIKGAPGLPGMYDLRRGAVSIGSISWAAGNAAGIFSVPSAVTFMPGDVLAVLAGSGGGLESVGMTLRLTIMGAT